MPRGDRVQVIFVGLMIAASILASCTSPPGRREALAPSAPAATTAESPAPTSATEAPQSQPVEAASIPAAQAPTPSIQAPIGPVEVFPHVRVDTRARTVEVDASVACDAPADASRIVFLEVLVCTPNTREHESLLVTAAMPSHVHAAMLLVGLQPGLPGEWRVVDGQLTPVAPRGEALNIDVKWQSAGTLQSEPIADWAWHPGDQRTLSGAPPAPQAGLGSVAGSASRPSWLFAGSRIVSRNGSERYAADGSGTLVGLTAFGDETIAWSAMYSPEASIEEPQWIARPGKLPPRGTAVVIAIRGSTPAQR